MGLKRFLIRKLPPRYQVPARYWYRFFLGRLDPELKVLVQLSRLGGRAIDVGANYGLYTYAFARLFPKVEAFEPLPDCADLIEAYSAANVAVHRVALSAEPGTRPIFVPILRGAPDAGRASFGKPDAACVSVTAKVRTLDSFSFTDVAAIKIDVEGHELDVLHGSIGTLRRERPVVLVEIEQRHLSIPMEGVFDYMTEQEYVGFFLEGNRLMPLTTFSYDKHQRAHLGNTDSRKYVNNFFFLPAEASMQAVLRTR